MELEEILKSLEHNTGKFPRRALEAAAKIPEELTPYLLDSLERVLDDPAKYEADHGFMAHIYAMYLLAQFRETRAYPLIVRFCRLPGELALDLSGDVITEDMDRILASVCGGDTEPIKELIEDSSLNEYVRDAAVKALLALFGDGQIERTDLVDYYKSLFAGNLEREYSFVWEGLAELLLPNIPTRVHRGYREGLQRRLDSGEKHLRGIRSDT